MFTARTRLRTGKLRSDGRAPIALVITANRKRTYLATGLYLKPAAWDERRGRARGRTETAARINRRLSELLSLCEAEGTRLLTEGHTVTAQAIRQAVEADVRPERPSEQKDEGVDLLRFFWTVVEGYRDRGQEWSYQKQLAILRKLRRFCRQHDLVPLRPEMLTPQVARQWYDWLRAAPPRGLGNSANTAADNIGRLRSWCRQAEHDELIDRNPVSRLRPKRTKVRKDRLTADQVAAIASLSEGLGDGARYSGTGRGGGGGRDYDLLAACRDAWLLACYCAGIRSSDIATLTFDRFEQRSDGRTYLRYQMGKTGEQSSVRLVPPAETLVAHYRQVRADKQLVFGFLDSKAEHLKSPRWRRTALAGANALLNKQLKVIAVMAGLSKSRKPDPDAGDVVLTMHVARHSFADMARQSGWSVYDISRALRHSSIGVTETYLSTIDERAVDKGLDELFG
jgi:integrase